MEKLEPVQKAVAEDRVVIACAYTTHIPAEIRDQLPTGAASGPFVARIEDGKVVAIRSGRPEVVIGGLLDGR